MVFLFDKIVRLLNYHLMNVAGLKLNFTGILNNRMNVIKSLLVGEVTYAFYTYIMLMRIFTHLI